MLSDPNASAEEIQQAALAGLFQVADYAFEEVVSSFDPGQYVQVLGHHALQSTAYGVMEHVAPWGLGKIGAAVSRSSRSLLANGKQLISKSFRISFCGTEKCFPAGTMVVARWSSTEPTDDPAKATGSVDIASLVISERIAQEETQEVARRLMGRWLDESTIWSLRSEHWWVVSRDEATGKLLWQRVRTTSMNETDELVAVSLSDDTGRIVERIEATAEHPFFTTRGQVKAGDLGIGTQIITRAGPTLTIASVERVKQGQTVPVFNFEVEEHKGSGTEGDGHSYFVGNALGGVWVHNGCTGKNYTGPGMSATRRQALPITPGIYYVRNEATGQKYIGRAEDPRDRLLDAEHKNARNILDSGSDADVKVTVYPVTFTGNAGTDRGHAFQIAEQMIMNLHGTVPQSKQANAVWLNDIAALKPGKFRRYTNTLLRRTKKTYLDLTPTIGNGQDY